MISSRRGFLTGLGAFILAAPAIVHAGNLMPVKVVGWDLGAGDITAINVLAGGDYYSDLVDATRLAFLPRIASQFYKTQPLMVHILRPDGRYFPEHTGT